MLNSVNIIAYSGDFVADMRFNWENNVIFLGDLDRLLCFQRFVEDLTFVLVEICPSYDKVMMKHKDLPVHFLVDSCMVLPDFIFDYHSRFLGDSLYHVYLFWDCLDGCFLHINAWADFLLVADYNADVVKVH